MELGEFLNGRVTEGQPGMGKVLLKIRLPKDEEGSSYPEGKRVCNYRLLFFICV